MAHSATRKEVVDRVSAALRVILTKNKPTPNVCKPGFVEEPICKDLCIADRVILAPNGLGCREARPELGVAGNVGLIALIQMVAVTDVVCTPQAVIDASHAVPEVGWPCDRNANCTGLDQHIIDRSVLQALIISHNSMNIGKELQRIERSLPRSGRFPVSQRYGRECGVSVGGRYCCRRGIRCTGGFPAPIALQ